MEPVSSADFQRSVIQVVTQGDINWSSSTGGDTVGGSGGFSAYGSNASVNLGGTSTPGDTYLGRCYFWICTGRLQPYFRFYPIECSLRLSESDCVGRWYRWHLYRP